MNLIADLLDIIYPPRCHVCMDFIDRAPDKAPEICNNCLENIREISHPYCPVCGLPFSSKAGDDHLCEKCILDRPHFDEMRAPYFYEGPIMEAVHRIKYSGRSDIINSLVPVLVKFTRNWLSDTNKMLIIPVPLHKKKLRQRGYNQSVLIARKIHRQLGAELDYLSLKRIRYTKTQTGLNVRERQRNVKGAFEVCDESIISGRDVILVDDVATTGSTMNECAKELKNAGCGKVFGLVLARTAVY